MTYGSNEIGQLQLDQVQERIDAFAYCAQGLYFAAGGLLHLIPRADLLASLNNVSHLAAPSILKIKPHISGKLPAPLVKSSSTTLLRIKPPHAFVHTAAGLQKVDLTSKNALTLESTICDFAVFDGIAFWLTPTGQHWRLRAEGGEEAVIYGEGRAVKIVGSSRGFWVVGPNWHTSEPVASRAMGQSLHIKTTPGDIIGSFADPDGNLTLLIRTPEQEWVVHHELIDGGSSQAVFCQGTPIKGETIAYFGTDRWMGLLYKPQSSNEDRFGLSMMYKDLNGDVYIHQPFVTGGDPLGAFIIEGPPLRLAISYAIDKGGKPYGSALLIDIQDDASARKVEGMGDPINSSMGSHAGPCCFADGWLLTARYVTQPSRTSLIKVQRLA